MSYNNDSEQQPANGESGIEERPKLANKKQAQKYVGGKPRNGAVQNSKSTDGQRRNKSGKRDAPKLHDALSKLPMPKT